MQDRLEDFVKANRDAFDEASPREELWKKIEGRLDGREEKVKPLTSNLWMWKAAVVVLLAAVTFLAIDRFVPQKQVVAVDEVASSPEDFEDLESFYTSLIDEKSEKLSFELKGEEFFNYLEGDIEEIDAIYLELKETYTNGQESQIVMDRLIHLLRQKLHLINSQLDILEEAKNPVRTREDETTAL